VPNNKTNGSCVNGRCARNIVETSGVPFAKLHHQAHGRLETHAVEADDLGGRILEKAVVLTCKQGQRTAHAHASCEQHCSGR
jgi:hypothetical protein